MINIAAYAVGDIGVASSRLRSFYLFQSSADYGVDVCRNPGIWQSLKYGYLHLQKRYKPKYIAQALIFRLLGKKVIFDLDDNPKGIYELAIIVLMKIVTIVTTDTDARRSYFARYVNKNKIIVLPDVLDVNPDKIDQVVSRKSSQSRGIFWIGHRDNLGSIEKLFDIVTLHKDYHMVVATNLLRNDELHNKYPKVKFIDWRLDISLNPSIDAAYMVLNHDAIFDPNSIYKSENKMVLAIASGLVPIVSRTPSYEALAKVLEAERLIFDDLTEVLDIIEKIDQMWADDFLARAKSYVLANYTSDHVFSLFLSKCLLVH